MSQPEEAFTRAVRLFKLVSVIASNPPGAVLGRDELSFECGCETRTIQRDVNLLKKAGIPLEYDRHTRSYTLPDKNWAFPVVRLTPQDTLALALARGLLTAQGAPSRERLLAVLDKTTAGLPPALKTLLTEAAAVVRPAALVRDYAHTPMEALIQATASRQSVEIDYDSRTGGERHWRRIDPYAVEPRDGQFWELHGWDHKRQAIRTFALDRVFGMRGVGETFAVRESAWADFAGATGVIGGLRGGDPELIDVQFAAPVAPYALARRWPDGLTCAAQDDGSARLTGTVQGLDGITAELLRWRRHAHVLAGPALRQRMQEELTAMLAFYNT